MGDQLLPEGSTDPVAKGAFPVEKGRPPPGQSTGQRRQRLREMPGGPSACTAGAGRVCCIAWRPFLHPRRSGCGSIGCPPGRQQGSSRGRLGRPDRPEANPLAPECGHGLQRCHIGNKGYCSRSAPSQAASAETAAALAGPPLPGRGHRFHRIPTDQNPWELPPIVPERNTAIQTGQCRLDGRNNLT